MVKAVEVLHERKSIMCSSNYQSMAVRHKKLQRIDCTLNVTLEHPGVHCNVFMWLECIPTIVRMAIIVNNNTNIEGVLILITIISVVVYQDIWELLTQFDLSGRLPVQPCHNLIFIKFELVMPSFTISNLLVKSSRIEATPLPTISLPPKLCGSIWLELLVSSLSLHLLQGWSLMKWMICVTWQQLLWECCR